MTFGSARIALVTQGYQSAGGVQTVARWLVKMLNASGHIVTVFDLAASMADSYSRRLATPSSWYMPSLLSEDPVDRSITHVGANAVEIEPLRYFPRRQLSRELRKYDLVQVVSGGASLALAAVTAGPPIVLQVATTVAWE